MITLAWYLLKVIICSGILCSYYFLALRNKVFHRWNRFYLLAAIIISLSAPIMKIDIFQNSNKGTVVQMLQTISYGDEVVVEYSRNNGFQINTQNLAEGAYLLISVIFLIIFFVSLYKIKRMKKKYPETKIEDVSFISTNAKGTPFSFFKSIFWNNAIDLHSKPGQQIFNHEIAHVKEKHSYDKIFMNLVLIFFWINPFFWLMRKELYMIHEFVADKEALEDSDINAFAEMILQTVYPGQNFSVTNKFFYSPIKRRILMLTKNKNPKVSYVSRLLVLPLAAIVFFAFTLKVKSKNNLNSYDGQQITVVIDAGHGGDDNGAHSSNGLKEKDITLSIAKKIAALNSNEHINILLSRNNDQSISVRDRVHFAKKNDADLFVSIHVNGAVDEQLNGFSVLIDKNNSEKNQLLASSLINELKATYKTDNKIEVRSNGLGIFVVDSNSCPTSLVECGYMTNPNDVAFISKDANQEKIAKNILTAINNYASSLTDHVSEVVINDSVPSPRKDSISYSIYYKGKKLKSTKYVDNEKKVEATYSDGSNETITKEEALKRGFIPPPPPPGLPPSHFKAKNLYVVNGKIATNTQIKNIDPNKIKSISILEPNRAIKKYGNKGKDGAVEIIMKNKNDIHEATGTDSIPKKVYQKVEVEASFPGGPGAWQKYIVRKIQASLDSFTNTDYGTCVIRFIVDVDGRVSDVQATTMKGTLLAKISVDAIKSGPKWTPASQNGHVVAAYRLQPVTLKNSGNKKNTSAQSEPPIISTSPGKEIDNGKVFTKIDQSASFPGGQASWLKYLSQIFDKNGNELMSDKNNSGTCKVRFIVSKDGKVSDVKAVTMEGTHLADVAVNAIKKGPRWNPGMQNGKTVNSYVFVPVTFKLSDNLMNKPE
jgi:N-acetylmuramoyl-L-alanine amidase/outer membrane biosynthesis protein TonB